MTDRRLDDHLPAAVPLPRDHRSDAELAHDVSEVIAIPRRAPADSFVLHAPLELLARIGLLRFVRDDRRAEARSRIAELARSFRAQGDHVDPPAPLVVDDLRSGAARLVAAIERGELDDVDAAAAWLARHVRPHELAPLLADAVLPSLAAAGHAPIFLWLYPRLAPQRDVSAAMLRQLCRELAREPHRRLRWIDESRPAHEVSAAELARAVASAPVLGTPASTFIHPLMSRVDRPDLAGSLGPLVGGRAVAARGRALLRLAAGSMLDEPGRHAPYGWSHCLTMPQAVLGLAGSVADPSRALAVAASHAYGFRASLASRPLDLDGLDLDGLDGLDGLEGEGAVTRARALGVTPSVVARLTEALAAGPAPAGEAVWGLPDEALGAARAAVATAAATHHDAHLAKYVLACIDAAADDPPATRWFLAAAATLCGWWATRPDGVEIG